MYEGVDPVYGIKNANFMLEVPHSLPLNHNPNPDCAPTQLLNCFKRKTIPILINDVFHVMPSLAFSSEDTGSFTQSTSTITEWCYITLLSGI